MRFVLYDELFGALRQPRRCVYGVLGVGAASLQRWIILERHQRFSVVCLELMDHTWDEQPMCWEEGFITTASKLHRSEPTDQRKGKMD